LQIHSFKVTFRDLGKDTNNIWPRVIIYRESEVGGEKREMFLEHINNSI